MQQKTHWSTGILNDCPSEHRAILDQELRRLEETLDALSDLLMAESVYQMAQGNTERSSAALRVLNDGGTIDKPEVVTTPQRGFTYWQRVGIAMDGSSTSSMAWNTAVTPRSRLNAPLNQWLSRQLPDPSQIAVTVWLPNKERLTWPLSQADFQPIDLLAMIEKTDGLSQESELCLRIKEQIRKENKPDTKSVLNLDFHDKTGFNDGQCSIMELLPLLRILSTLLELARPMLPEDVMVQSEASQAIQLGQFHITDIYDEITRLLGENGEESLTMVITRLQHAYEKLGQEQSQPEQGYDALYRALLEVAAYGSSESIPRLARQCTTEAITGLRLQANEVITLLHKKMGTARSKLQDLPDETTPRERWEALVEIAQLIFGRSFKLFPGVTLLNASVLNNAMDRETLHGENQEFAKEEWLQGVALVRSQIKRYNELATLREAFHVEHHGQTLRIIQLPHGESPWIACNLPGEELTNGDTLSLAMELTEPLMSTHPYVGMVIDEWQEFLPDQDAKTGVTFNYNQPDSEAPQVLLLTVSPQETDHWKWDDLMATIRETMELAKKRAVDPELIKNSPLSHFLPAITGPINDQNLYPVVDFAKNIKVSIGKNP